ncbi:MAG: hypothetical protein CMK07_05500 [Ponticaulis sp.]|nr:hypothetical protein [Ponticaulis sp.]
MKETIYRFEGFTLNATRHVLESGGNVIAVQPQVMALLILLVENANETVQKTRINQEIWHGRAVSDAALASRLSALRSALGDSGTEQRLIRTVPNVGVQFVGDVNRMDVHFYGPLTAGWNFLKDYYRLVALAVVASLAMGIAVWYWGFDLPAKRLRAQFDMIPDAAIRYYNHKKLRNASVEDCMRACLRTTEFICRSFDYYKLHAVCDLSAATAESVGGLKTDYELDPYNHYARKDYPQGPIEMGRDDTLDPPPDP